jgi:YVTN family beta-propeller protein
MQRKRLVAVASWMVLGFVAVAATTVTVKSALYHMGKQPDGTFVVATGQRIGPGTISFKGRASDLALSPDGSVFAVLGPKTVFLCNESGVIPGASVDIGGEPAFHGIAWTPDGKRILFSTAKGYVQSIECDGTKLTKGVAIKLLPDGDDRSVVPGGMCVTPDGQTLYVTSADLNKVFAVDLATNAVVKSYSTESMPFEPRLSSDGKTLVVSNWAGRLPKAGDLTGKSERMDVVVDEKTSASTGTVSMIDIESGTSTSVPVGLHPSAIVVGGDKAYIADSMSDEIAVVDVPGKKLERTFPIRFNKKRLIGSMPDDLALLGDRLYVADAGDNAIAVININSGRTLGMRPAGFFPVAIAVHASTAYVLNSKGNGSVYKLAHGSHSGNVHDFEGTISVIDLQPSLDDATQLVAALNGWVSPPAKPSLAVYNGAIQHVLYIIKENRTYDEYFGDMKQGNGDPTLCSIGLAVSPNHHALARMFTLFDNGYVTGTNSAEGHNWCDEALCDDYLEHFYVGYSRTYPDDGSDAMALSPSGCIWDAALKKGKTFRDWGEFADPEKARYAPSPPPTWFAAYEDYKAGTHKYKYIADTDVANLRPYLDKNYHYWPLIQSDQARASEFIREYTEFSKTDTVPNLMEMSLPSDHTSGINQTYPTPRSMVADNDLALGRIVDAVSHSPQWKNTCIFVIEDDAQNGPDHVDGHRTAYQVFSPYVKHGAVDSHFYTTLNMVKSIEMMLGLDPLNRFDYLAGPIDTAFTNTPDLTPYSAVPNTTPIGEHSPKRSAMTPLMRHWSDVSARLDWSHADAADPDKLNHIIWASVHPDGRPYPFKVSANVGD